MEVKCRLETICELYAVERSEKWFEYSKRKVDQKAYWVMVNITKTTDELKYMQEYYHARVNHYERPIKIWKCMK